MEHSNNSKSESSYVKEGSTIKPTGQLKKESKHGRMNLADRKGNERNRSPGMRKRFLMDQPTF